MTQNKTWWASYDPQTFAYTGMRLASDKPDNATDVKFDGLINPVWNPTTNQWTGDNLSDQLAKLQAEANEDNKMEDTPIASLTSVVADYAKLKAAIVALGGSLS